jgi:hypothetical protein
MTEHEHEPIAVEETMYCAVHPDRETALQCNRCGRYMCVECAVHTPVGYRCRECVHEQTDKFFTATNADYVIIFAVCAVLSLIAGTLVTAFPLGIFAVLLAVPIGGAIGQVALRATGRRRGRNSTVIAVAGALIGGLLAPSAYIFLTFGVLLIDPQILFRNYVLLLFVGLVAVSIGGMFRVRI